MLVKQKAPFSIAMLVYRKVKFGKTFQYTSFPFTLSRLWVKRLPVKNGEFAQYFDKTSTVLTKIYNQLCIQGTSFGSHVKLSNTLLIGVILLSFAAQTPKPPQVSTWTYEIYWLELSAQGTVP